MKSADWETDFEFQGKDNLLLVPGMRLGLWKPGESYFQSYMSTSSLEEVEKRWKDFSRSTGMKGLKFENKDMVCTDYWAAITPNAFQVFVYPETFKNFATANLGFTYSNGKEGRSILREEFYGVGVAGLVTVDDSYVLLGVRPDSRLDTIPAGFLEPEDLLQENPIVYAFRKEGRRNSLQPENVKEKDVLRSRKWWNLSAYLEGKADMASVKEDFRLTDNGDFCRPKKERLVFLDRKDPEKKNGKYASLILCPDARLQEYVSCMGTRQPEGGGEYVGERTAAVLKRYLKVI